MSELTKNVKPLDDFNWEEFENGTSVNVSKEELDKALDPKEMLQSHKFTLK